MASNVITMVLRLKDEATGPTRKAAEAAGSLADRARAGVMAAGKMSAGLLAAGAAAASFVQHTADLINEIGDMSARTGVATDTLKGLKLAAESSGGQLSDMNEVINPLVAKMGQIEAGAASAMEGFDRYGVAVKDAEGNTLSTDAVLRNVIATLEGMEDPAEKARAAVALLGESGGKLVEALGSGSFAAAVAMANEFGGKSGPAAAKAAADWQTSVAQLRLVLEGLVSDLGTMEIATWVVQRATLGLVYVITFLRVKFAEAAKGLKFLVLGFQAWPAILSGNTEEVNRIGNAIRDLAAEKLPDASEEAEKVAKRFYELRENSKNTKGEIDGLAGTMGGLAGKFDDAAESAEKMRKAVSAQADALSELAEIGNSALPEQVLTASEEAMLEFERNAARVEQLVRQLVTEGFSEEAAAAVGERVMSNLTEQLRRKLDSAQLAELEGGGMAAADASLGEGSPEGAPNKLETIKGTLGNISGAVNGGLKSILAALGPAGAIAGAVIGLLQNLDGLVTGLIEEVDQIIVSLLEALPKVLAEDIPALVTQLLVELPKIIPDIIEGLVGAIPEFSRAIIEALPDIITAFAMLIPELYLAILRAGFELAKALVTELPGALADAFKQTFADLWDAAGDFVAEVMAQIVDPIRSALDPIVSPIMEFARRVMVPIQRGIEEVRDLIRMVTEPIGRLVSSIMQFLQKASQPLRGEEGKILGTSFKRGEGSLFGLDTSLPRFASGGMVNRTGMALVHQGERIIPPSGVGSQTTMQAAGQGSGGPPVHITVNGWVTPSVVDQMVREVRNALGANGRGLSLEPRTR